MENASKALLMAAGILMAVAILSLAAFLYASFGGSTEQIQDKIEQGQLDQFNNQFVQYTAKDCTIYDIMSVVNLANDYNTRNGFEKGDTNYYININVNGKDVNDFTIDTLKEKVLSPDKEYSEIITEKEKDKKYNLIKFSCSVDHSQVTGKVNNVKFTSK